MGLWEVVSERARAEVMLMGRQAKVELPGELLPFRVTLAATSKVKRYKSASVKLPIFSNPNPHLRRHPPPQSSARQPFRPQALRPRKRALMSSIHLPALHMSHIIAPDAPLTSPVSESLSVAWDRDPALAALYDPFSFPSSVSPPSVMPGTLPDTRKVLKGRLTPDAERCLPTHQVFDFVPGSLATTPIMGSSPASTPASSPQTEPQPLPQRSDAQHTFSAASSPSEMPSAGSVVVPAKRPSIAQASCGSTKKARSGERVSTKDFVPPDVTGLSKREARLVKNRAAAFLSRQRKREEFETMEM